MFSYHLHQAGAITDSVWKQRNHLFAKAHVNHSLDPPKVGFVVKIQVRKVFVTVQKTIK
jgi:hypothetical protein